jgi:RES domain-containing protein
MPVTSWRIVKEKYIGAVFTGDGAKKGGGRWNNIGTTMVYTASSLSLATLEALAHQPSYKMLRVYKCIPISFDESVVLKLSSQPPGWDMIPPTAVSMSVSVQWIKDAQFAVLQIPSIITPGESNFLINPNHPDFPKMTIGSPLDFPYDSRLEEK